MLVRIYYKKKKEISVPSQASDSQIWQPDLSSFLFSAFPFSYLRIPTGICVENFSLSHKVYPQSHASKVALRWVGRGGGPGGVPILPFLKKPDGSFCAGMLFILVCLYPKSENLTIRFFLGIWDILWTSSPKGGNWSASHPLLVRPWSLIWTVEVSVEFKTSRSGLVGFWVITYGFKLNPLSFKSPPLWTPQGRPRPSVPPDRPVQRQCRPGGRAHHRQSSSHQIPQRLQHQRLLCASLSR